jgi:hypothetical protein
MTSQLNAQLARVIIDARLRTAQDQRRPPRTHTYSMPVVREIPRPVGAEAFDTSVW